MNKQILSIKVKKVFLILSSRRKEALEEVVKECENPERIKILPLDLEDYSKLELKNFTAYKQMD